MCFAKIFSTKSAAKKFVNNPKIAKRDIPVWKYLRVRGMDCLSPFRGMRYQKGYHYYITNKKTFGIRIEDCSTYYVVVEIERGLHSYKKQPPSLESMGVKMYIPEGALYYQNDEEIVSSALMWY